MITQTEIEIPEIGKRLYLPTSLWACNREQFIDFCGLLMQHQSGRLSFSELRLAAVYKLLDLKQGHRELQQDQLDAANENIALIADQVSSFFDFTEQGASVRMEYTGSRVEYIDTPSGKLYGPKSHFVDVTFGEYEAGLNVFMEYQGGGGQESLYKLLAIFFGEQTNGKRQRLDPQDMESKVKRVSKAPIEQAFAFYYEFAGFHQYFTSSAVMWQGQKLDLSIIFSDQPEDDIETYKSPYPGLGITTMAHQLAESQVFGHLEKVRASGLWEVILRLYDIRKRDLDYKARTKIKEKG